MAFLLGIAARIETPILFVINLFTITRSSEMLYWNSLKRILGKPGAGVGWGGTPLG